EHASRKFLGPGSPEVLPAGHGDPAFFVLVKGWNRARSASDRIFLNGHQKPFKCVLVFISE
ncbi:hypothetical protein K9M78_06180, partial [Candidatus Bipolaricaulota bacterium]|nr:hypothetical protein [Candidatus Bipolaricaulota bacterium]